MKTQTILTPSGDRLVVLSEADFETLVEAAEDASDFRSVAAFRNKLAAGEEELVPAPIVDRLLDGENQIKVWREYRGLTSQALAEKAGIGQGFLSQIETGKRAGTVDTLRKIAAALNVTIDDLVGAE